MRRYRIDNPKEVISEIQTYLLEITYVDQRIPKITIDGVYGQETRDAVSAFQQTESLPVTGIVDYITWTRLYERYSEAREAKQPSVFLEEGVFTLRLGDIGNAVTVLQSQLGEFSRIYPNVTRPAITGQFGLATADAVRAIQRNYGLYADGIVDIPLWNRMQRDYRAQKELRRVQATGMLDEPGSTV